MLLTLLLVWPLIGALALAILKPEAARNLAFGISMVSLALVGYLLYMFEPMALLQNITKEAWIPDLGISYYIGLDGISMLMVLLTTVLTPVIILATPTRGYTKSYNLFALMLAMQSAMLGVYMSFDGFLYYVFWELALVPIYFIILLYGGPTRVKATFKFFIYTIAGSLLMLVGFIYLYLQTPAPHTFAYEDFLSLRLSGTQQKWLFWAFFGAFAIKIPIFPFHTWQPDTYTQSPPPGTMLLSGIMLKMGLYSILRWLLPIMPIGVAEWTPVVMVITVIGIVYASWIALTQRDLKRLFAYSSIAHVGMLSAALFTLTLVGIQGSLIGMMSHGVTVVGLFIVAQIVAERARHSQLPLLGGIRHRAPLLAACFLIILLGSIALPLTSGFVGEFMMLQSLFEYNLLLALFAGTTVIFSAVYMLRAYSSSMLGEVSEDTQVFADLKPNETVALLILSGLVIVIGVFPKPFMDITEPTVRALLAHIYPGSGSSNFNQGNF